jgi:RNA recognition motif-containing protein
MQIYVGNLPLSFSDDDLRSLFQPHGIIRSAAVGRDRKTGESQGYGFVEMPVKSEARTAIEALRGKEFEGKPLRVRALKPGDDFHDHALSLQGASKGGMKLPGKSFQGGNLGPRASGAIRRGGKRGA